MRGKFNAIVFVFRRHNTGINENGSIMNGFVCSWCCYQEHDRLLGSRKDNLKFIGMKDCFFAYKWPFLAGQLFSSTFCPDLKQGKKVCKVTALRCYQCFSLHFLLSCWQQQSGYYQYHRNSYTGELLTAPERSKKKRKETKRKKSSQIPDLLCAWASASGSSQSHFSARVLLTTSSLRFC